MDQLWAFTLNGLVLGSIYALVALGYSLAFSVLRFINFAHADVYMFCALVGYSLWRFFHAEGSGIVWVIVPVGVLLVGSLLGGLIEWVAYRPLRKAPRINVLITAIGVSLGLQTGALMIFGADPKFFQLPLPQEPLGWGLSYGDLLIWGFWGRVF